MRRFLVDLIIWSWLPERYISDSYPSTSRQATLGIANQLAETTVLVLGNWRLALVLKLLVEFRFPLGGYGRMDKIEVE